MSDAFAELIVAQTESRTKVVLQDWYNDSWEFRKNITLSLNTATGVDSDLTDFPALVSITDLEIFEKTNETDLKDIIFTASDGTTKLAHEIERYDSSTGEVIAWVKIPTLSASDVTDIYIYYKGLDETDTYTTVWDDNYRMILHMNQSATGSKSEGLFSDVTDNGNDATAGGDGRQIPYNSNREPIRNEGQIGYGQKFRGPTTTGSGQGSGEFLWVHNVNNWPSRDATIELWVGDITASPGTGVDYNDMFSYCKKSTSSSNIWENHWSLWQAKKVKMKVQTHFYVSTTAGPNVENDNPASFTDWNHIMAVYNLKDADGTTGKSQLYINGELYREENRSGGQSHTINSNAKNAVAIGGDIDSSSNSKTKCDRVNNEFKGKMDELRVSAGMRSASWAAASYFNQGDPDTYTTIDVEETRIEVGDVSGACGFDRDCTAPRITNHGTSETPDGFSINDNIFEENQERYNENPTIRATVGEPVTVGIRAWENMGTDRLSLAIAYLAMHDEKPDWRDSRANIEFKIQQDEFKVYDKDKIFSAVGVETEKVTDPYGNNPSLELLDITFTLIFAKPMEPSHIGIQTIDDINNYDLVYFDSALEILPKEIVEIEDMPEGLPEDIPQEVPEIVPEEIPEEVPEEFVPEPEPPVKEPEPEVMLTTINEKTVLEFVDENMPVKHYVKRYITETDYKEWFDVNYSDYKFWEGIGITQERFDQIVLEIESEPEPKMIQTGFVFVPENEKSFPLVEQTYEPEPPELEPVKEEKKGFFDWLFDLFN